METILRYIAKMDLTLIIAMIIFVYSLTKAIIIAVKKEGGLRAAIKDHKVGEAIWFGIESALHGWSLMMKEAIEYLKGLKRRLLRGHDNFLDLVQDIVVATGVISVLPMIVKLAFSHGHLNISHILHGQIDWGAKLATTVTFLPWVAGIVALVAIVANLAKTGLREMKDFALTSFAAAIVVLGCEMLFGEGSWINAICMIAAFSIIFPVGLGILIYGLAKFGIGWTFIESNIVMYSQIGISHDAKIIRFFGKIEGNKWIRPDGEISDIEELKKQKQKLLKKKERLNKDLERVEADSKLSRQKTVREISRLKHCGIKNIRNEITKIEKKIKNKEIDAKREIPQLRKERRKFVKASKKEISFLKKNFDQRSRRIEEIADKKICRLYCKRFSFRIEELYAFLRIHKLLVFWRLENNLKEVMALKSRAEELLKEAEALKTEFIREKREKLNECLIKTEREIKKFHKELTVLYEKRNDLKEKNKQRSEEEREKLKLSLKEQEKELAELQEKTRGKISEIDKEVSFINYDESFLVKEFNIQYMGDSPLQLLAVKKGKKVLPYDTSVDMVMEDLKTSDEILVKLPINVRRTVINARKCIETPGNWEGNLKAHATSACWGLVNKLEFDKLDELPTSRIKNTILKLNHEIREKGILSFRETYGFELEAVNLKPIEGPKDVVGKEREIYLAQLDKKKRETLAEAKRIEIQKEAEGLQAEIKALGTEGDKVAAAYAHQKGLAEFDGQTLVMGQGIMPTFDTSTSTSTSKDSKNQKEDEDEGGD